MNSEDLGHFQRRFVNTLVTGAKKNRERNQCLDQISAMQIYVMSGLRDYVAKQPIGDLFGSTTMRITGKYAIRILAVERTDVNRTRTERRHIDNRHHDHAPGKASRIKRASEFERGRDTGIFSRMDPSCHDERRPFSYSIDEPHRKPVRLMFNQKFVHTVP